MTICETSNVTTAIFSIEYLYTYYTVWILMDELVVYLIRQMIDLMFNRLSEEISYASKIHRKTVLQRTTRILHEQNNNENNNYIHYRYLKYT